MGKSYHDKNKCTELSLYVNAENLNSMLKKAISAILKGGSGKTRGTMCDFVGILPLK